MGTWLITLSWVAAALAPGGLTPVERVEQALRCEPGARVCSNVEEITFAPENEFPSPVVLRVDQREDGGLDALVLRRSILHGGPGTLLFRYSLSADGARVSSSCIWNLPQEGSSIGSVRAPDSFWEGTTLHYSNRCRNEEQGHRWGTTFRLDGMTLKATATPPPKLNRVIHTTWATPEAVGTRYSKVPMSTVFRRRAFPLPPGSLRTTLLQGYGYRIPADEPGRIWIVDEDHSDARNRERVEKFNRERGGGLPVSKEFTIPGTLPTDENTPVFELAIGELSPGAILVGPRSELVIEADGIPLRLPTHESGLQLDVLIDPTLKKGWLEARARLPADLEAAIWAPPLLLAADHLFRITPAGAELLCASMETTDASVGLPPFGYGLPSTRHGSEPDLPGLPRDPGPAYGGGSLYMPWQGGIKVGRCVSEGPSARKMP